MTYTATLEHNDRGWADTAKKTYACDCGYEVTVREKWTGSRLLGGDVDVSCFGCPVVTYTVTLPDLYAKNAWGGWSVWLYRGASNGWMYTEGYEDFFDAVRNCRSYQWMVGDSVSMEKAIGCAESVYEDFDWLSYGREQK